jgi:TPR repeat protein
MAVGTDASDRPILPYWLSSATEKDSPADISQRFKRAQKGDAESQLIVGRKYLELQNFSQALYWFEKSAGQGNIEAQIHLGDAYARGNGVSVAEPRRDNGWVRGQVPPPVPAVKNEPRTDCRGPAGTPGLECVHYTIGCFPLHRHFCYT